MSTDPKVPAGPTVVPPRVPAAADVERLAQTPDWAKPLVGAALNL